MTKFFSKLSLMVLLAFCLVTTGGEIAIVMYGLGPGASYQSLVDTLLQEGHDVDYEHPFDWREPDCYDIFFLTINDVYLATSQIESLQSFIEAGGYLVLQECRYYPRTSDCLSEVGWSCFTGNPRWNVIFPTDSLPSIRADSIHPGYGVSFATVFSESWKPTRGIDTLTSLWFSTYTFEDSGALQAVAFGGDDISTGLYDSFPPVILNGRCGRGEITVIGSGIYFLGDFFEFNMLRFHDNCQFARQLFQCNERADSAWLVLENDSTAKAFLEHDSLLFIADSSFWEVRFTVDTIRNYSFYGYEFTAEGFGDSLAVTFRPGYFYDTVEVCLVRLPDSTGETILPCGRICDTFPERTGIAETPTPEHFGISAYPNPFNSAVTITAPAGAEIEVFDVNGRRIAERIPPPPL